jgi:predicted RecA/RadA family phage recombinase
MQNECIPYYEAVGKTFSGPLTLHQGAGPGLAADPLPTGDGGNLQCPAAPAAGGQTGGVFCWDVASGSKAALIRGTHTFLPVTSGAAVAVGDLLMVDTQGRVLLATAGNYIVGKAHSAAGAAGVDVIVELFDALTKA